MWAVGWNKTSFKDPAKHSVIFFAYKGDFQIYSKHSQVLFGAILQIQIGAGIKPQLGNTLDKTACPSILICLEAT